MVTVKQVIVKKIAPQQIYLSYLTPIMRLLLIAFFLAPACSGFLARVRDHFEKKFKKPECHLEWEDVVTPHCETKHEQV